MRKYTKRIHVVSKENSVLKRFNIVSTKPWNGGIFIEVQLISKP